MGAQGEDVEVQMYRPDLSAPVTHNCPEPVKLTLNATVPGAFAADALAAASSPTRAAAEADDTTRRLPDRTVEIILLRSTRHKHPQRAAVRTCSGQLIRR